jgi:hypothetical protein
MLKQGAAVGQRMSDFVPVTDDEPEEDYEYPQDGDEDPTLLGDGSGVEYGDQQEGGHQPHAEPEVDEADPDEYDASHEEKTQGGQEPQDTQDQYGQYTAAEQAEYEAEQAELEAQQAEDQTQQAVHETQQSGPETREDNEGQHADVAAEHTEEANDARQSEKAEDTSFVITDDVAVDPSHEVEPSAAASAPEVTNNPTGEARDGEDEDQDTAETLNAEPASSSTMPPTADDSVSNHSEYQDEDLIDWDDNLTHRPSEHDADDTDDYSKFLAEESANSETANKENPQTLETDNTDVVTGDHAAGGHDDTVDPAEIDLEDEDFEHHPEDADQEVPTAEAVDADANGEVQEQPETQTTANGAADSTSELRVTPEATQPQAEVVPSKESIRNEEDYIDFSEDEDNIDFDDDTLEEHEARMASEAGSKSPPGKRSLDDAGDDDQPELKKVKSS